MSEPPKKKVREEEIPVEERPLWIAPPRSSEDGEGGRIYLENFSKHYAEAYDLVIAVAEPISRQKLIQEFRIDKYPLYGAASTGRTAQELVERLRQFCKNPMPRSVVDYIFSAVSQYGHVKAVLYQSRHFLVCISTAVLRVLCANPTIAAAVIRTPAPFRRSAAPAPVLGFGNSDDNNDSSSSEGSSSSNSGGESGLGVPLLGLTSAADGHDARAVEIQSSQLHAVMEQCLLLRYPVVTEYLFADDSTTADLKIQLGKNTCVRPYQEKSLMKMCTGNRARSGLIVLACGAGKTLVGIAATCKLRKATIVLATSNVSVEQWAKEYKRWSSIEDKDIFRFTSDTTDDVDQFCSDDAGKLVIATYSMLAYSGARAEQSERIMQRICQRDWGLLVLDEVHVFPAEGVKMIVQRVNAHCMLGLTATLVREDSKIEDLNFMIGPKLYEANWLDLVAQGYLANVQCAEVRCIMPELFFRWYLRDDQPACMGQYLNAINPAKFMCTEFLIRYHEARNDKIIVFCDNVAPLKYYAAKLGKPVIHGDTKDTERLELLDRFQKSPSAMTLFISRVGDNSIDLPDANVVIEVSSLFGSRRQEAQRLGRILRPKRRSEAGDTHNAFFYALVNSNTKEVCFSFRRQSFLVDQGFSYKILTNLVERHRAAVPGPLLYETPDTQQELLKDVFRLVEETTSAKDALPARGPGRPSAAAAAVGPAVAVRRTAGDLGAYSAPRGAVYAETRTPYR